MLLPLKSTGHCLLCSWTTLLLSRKSSGHLLHPSSTTLQLLLYRASPGHLFHSPSMPLLSREPPSHPPLHPSPQISRCHAQAARWTGS
ncbi:hypothetical protein FKM82_018086 [Ascaphus truei]